MHVSEVAGEEADIAQQLGNTRGRRKHGNLEEVKVSCTPEESNKLERWAGVRACGAVLAMCISQVGWVVLQE